MKKFRILMLVIILLLASITVQVNQSNAETIGTDYQTKFLKDADTFQQTFVPLDQKNAKKFYKRALKDVKKKSINVKSDIKKLNSYSVFYSADDNLRIVNLDLTGSSEELHSLGIVYQNDVFVEASEMIIKEKDSVTGNVQVFKNGQLSLDQDVAITKESREIVKDTDTIGTYASPVTLWKKFNKCMVDNGVASWVINTIVVACAVVCIGSAGTLCTACVIGQSAFFGGKTGYCIGYVYHN